MSHRESPVRSLSAERLSASLYEIGGNAPPPYLNDIVAQARRTRQRPAWTFLERWIPMTIALRPAAVPRTAGLIALLGALLALLMLAYLLARASPSLPPAPHVQNGLIALATNGNIDVMQPDGTGRHTLVTGPEIEGDMIWSPD